MILLQNAVLALLVFALLYAISRGSERWSLRMTRRRDAPSPCVIGEQSPSGIRPAKFGARFKRS